MPIVRMLGSSPLTRGKLSSAWEGIKSSRLIPAHAGKTRASPQPAGQLGAHPRSRGENGQPVVDLIINVGSSPLTRGKPCKYLKSSRVVGLIPAHAGKTWGPSKGVGEGGAHPRSRGENLTPVPLSLISQGSSPLTRGKLSRARSEGTRSGLIPAHAGKTSAAT